MPSDSEPIKKYIIEGVEEVFDEFDEFEHENSYESFVVEASSVTDAKTKGEEILQAKISKDRHRRGYVSSPKSSAGQYGMYIACVHRISDMDGNVLYDYREGVNV